METVSGAVARLVADEAAWGAGIEAATWATAATGEVAERAVIIVKGSSSNRNTPIGVDRKSVTAVTKLICL